MPRPVWPTVYDRESPRRLDDVLRLSRVPALMTAVLVVSAMWVGGCGGGPCADVVCELGECDSSTGQCVNASECDRRSDCLAGYQCGADGRCVEARSCGECGDQERCVEGRCVDRDRVCEEMACERGECSVQEGACVNAEDCDGDDARCLAGYFCSEHGRCRPDLCEQRGISCEGNGVCVESVGECENPRRCATDDDCLDDHRCVDGRCRLADALCGDASGDGGCEGNRECRLEGGSAECVEPDECDTSLDCDEGRQCGGRDCIDMTQCHQDDLEPNDTVEEASDFHRVSRNDGVRGMLCGDDRDVYVLDTRDLIGAPTRGRLLVEARTLEHDRGLGRVDLEVDGLPGGARRADTGADGRVQSARIEEHLSAGDHGEVIVEVSAGEELAEAGVAYDLTVDMVPGQVVDACEEAERIAAGEPVRANTSDGTSTHLGASCTDASNNRLEKIYRVKLDRPSRLDVSLAPLDPSTDLALSLRKRCEARATELQCSDTFGAGGQETMSELLEPGTYDIIVEGAPGSGGGAFSLQTEATATTCAGEMAFCRDDQTARQCAYQWGSYETVVCEEGCDASTGRCAPPEADRCRSAQRIDGAEASEEDPLVVEETLDLSRFADDYRVVGGGCLGEQEELSHGPDKIYRVDLPPGMSVTADLKLPAGAGGSLYTFEECVPDSGACQRGASVPDERYQRESLVYSNQSEETETFYLVADTAQGELLEEVGVEIEIAEMFCEPGLDVRCEPEIGRTRQICGDSGAEWVDEQTCAWSCDQETVNCAVPDDCSSAPDITEMARVGRGRFEIDWQALTNQQEEEVCGLIDEEQFSQVSGPDAFLELELDEGERVEARMEGCCEGRGIVITGDCDDPNSACLDSDPETMPHDQTWQAVYTAPEQETVHVMVDLEDPEDATPDDSPLEVVIRQPCNRSSDELVCLGDRAVSVCNEEDGYDEPWHCENGCVDGRCGTPRGLVCADPIPIGDGESDERTFGSEHNIFPGEGSDIGGCDFGGGIGSQEPLGLERIYEIELEAGETLDASFGRDEGDTLVYLMEDCRVRESCLDNTAAGKWGSLEWTADEDETVYLVVDSTTGADPDEPYSLSVEID